MHQRRFNLPPLDLIQGFEAAARTLSFTRAAEELCITQSAVSRQIQALEEEVGVSLFLRHTRAVELTGAGAQLLMAVSQSLPRIDNAVRQIRQSAGRRVLVDRRQARFVLVLLEVEFRLDVGLGVVRHGRKIGIRGGQGQ